MLETSIVIFIILLAFAYLVRHIAAGIRGRSACAGCDCKCRARKSLGFSATPSNKLPLKEIRARKNGAGNPLEKALENRGVN